MSGFSSKDKPMKAPQRGKTPVKITTSAPAGGRHTPGAKAAAAKKRTRTRGR